MEDKIIDGRKLAFLRQEKLVKKIKKLKKQPRIVSILIGEDAPSVLYTQIKQKKAFELGIDFQTIKISLGVNSNPPPRWEEIIQKIEEMNNDPKIHGIMVQLPVPKEFLGEHKVEELLEKISPEKDVDGLNYAQKAGPFVPAAVKAVLSIFKDESISVTGKNVVVVGSSDLIGKPMAMELKKLGGLVTVCDRQTSNLQGETLEAQILVSATGVPGLITGDMVSDGVVVIDIGAEKVNGKVIGDIDFPSVYPKASKITPVPGGVGPMTVISLMENVVQSFEKAGK